MTNQISVGKYLATRLQQLGVAHLFSVPGDYTSDFLEIIDTQTSLKRIGNCNELNAGYAADGYARANGLGAVAVTTGVGSFSLLNAIGGSFVENIPVVAIIGTLSNTKLMDEINAGELYHHNVSTEDTNRTVYSPVTVAFERISNPITAPAQIDAAIIACISQSKPVAIEIMEDCYYMPCAEPQGTLSPVPLYESLEVLKSMNATNPPNKYAHQIVTAIDGAAQAVYSQLSSGYPILWVGKEIGTKNLQAKFTALQEAVGAPFVSSFLGKAVISEDNPWFLGMYDAVFTTDYTHKFLEQATAIVGLGVWNTDLNTFGSKSTEIGNISPVFASRDMVKDGENLYVQVPLEQVIDAVMALIQKNGCKSSWQQPTPPTPPTPPAPSTAISYDSFFAVLDQHITTDHLIVADIGLSSFGGSSSLKINRQNGFLAQNIWASIGWSVPAGLGASFRDDLRTFVIVGDGAFKLTCQAVSTMVQEGRNAVVFVLNNKVYGVEQMLLDPGPYTAGSTEPFEAANVLQEWDYVSLMKGFSNNAPTAKSAVVNTVGDLQSSLLMIDNDPNSTYLVSINLDERDYPSAWSRFVNP
ncbi:thiamine pyrophosphate-binding protein [Algoriphagus hitonicola]|uniref:Indolepyruvate decarboxylase n=1 Tax=Algoriphagus hitonicola TaxID=435880 RepID=A0A1I2PYQ7_9BACT|nr:thiamine pyrophosphate-binding protein [Algoriphagus hitonicola]SFG21158.1 indolepyruvate decarboxylase [Algoriphagus hitonicola]